MSAIQIRHGLEGAFLNDLSRTVAKSTLMRMAFEAVDAVQWPRPLPVGENATPEPVLRTLVPFCYCTGVFSSTEIATIAKTDPNVRYLCANDFPAWEQIRQFRRRNISHLRETLARMLHAVYDETNLAPAPGFFAFLVEADRRLRLAVEADCAAMDD
jgi:hypothetical protein